MSGSRKIYNYARIFLSILALISTVTFAYLQVSLGSGYSTSQDKEFMEKLNALEPKEKTPLKNIISNNWDYACWLPEYYKVKELYPDAIENIHEYESLRFDINQNERYQKLALYSIERKQILFFNVPFGVLRSQKISADKCVAYGAAHIYKKPFKQTYSYILGDEE